MSAQADPVLVRRILQESGVDQTVPSPGWASYVEAVAEALFDWLRDRVPGMKALASLAKGLGPTVAVVAAAAILLLLLWLARGLLSRRRLGSTARPAAVRAVASAVAEPRDRSGWRAQMESRLAGGDLTGALEALWWWLARSVSPGRVDPSWTSQELLARCGRIDLLPLVRTLDRLLYSPQRPTIDDVRRFAGRLEPLLP
jgi:hypothetical protein